MSGRPTSAKTKRQDRDNGSTESRQESTRIKSDVKTDSYNSGKLARTVVNDRGPSFRSDRARVGKDRREDTLRRTDKGYGRGVRYDTRTQHGDGDDIRDDVRRQADSKAFMDDSRLSKLVKKIGREDDRDRRITAAKQLKEYLKQPENAKTIIKVSDSLLMALQDVFYERTYKDVKQEMASCLGVVGYAMGRETQRYVEWIFANLSATQQDEVKILLLNALLETLKQDSGSHKLADIMPLVMNNCQSVLESADVPDILMAVVDVVLYVTESYPHVFASHFRDTVDILVGWHIDSTQKENLTAYTADALVSFHQFWIADMKFSVNLLGQFLEDMEAYVEDLNLGLSGHVSEEEMPTPEECITKIGALLHVFTTVMRSLGEYFMPDKGPAVTVEFMTGIVERTVRCIDGVLNVMYCEKVYTAANKCLMLLCTNLGPETVQVSHIVTEYLMKQCNNHRISTHAYILSFIQLMYKVIDILNTQLPVEFIAHILSPESVINSLRMAHKHEVLTELLGIYRSILGLKSVPLMEEAYKYILGDLEVAFNTLLETIESENQCSLVAGNPFSDVIYTTKQAETVIVFDVCALAEIGNTKNNIIGMWALSPSIFDLFARHLLPNQPSLMERYPAVQYALLQALYSHCSRHGHFISSSSLITHNTILEGTLLANVSPATGAHFSTALSLLGDLLTCENTPYDSRLLSLKWSQEIIDTLQSTQHIYETREFHQLLDALITSGYTSHAELCLAACQCIQTLLQHTNKMDATVLKRCMDLCKTRLSHTTSTVRQAYQMLLNALPLEVTASHQFGPPQSTSRARKTDASVTSSEAFWLARRAHMAKVPTGTFHSHNYRAVLGYLLYDLVPNKNGGISWLQSIYHSSQRSDKDHQFKEDTIQFTDLIDSSESLLWFWATWEVAQFCILSKLRTPLGKPQDTFTAIEATLKKYAADAKALDSEEWISSRGNTEKNVDEETSKGLSESQRVHLLLQFMEHLEKQLYNAYEGCAVAMVNPPKVVKTFFRTNRATCLEWLARIRHCLVTIGHQCGEPALVVRHTCEILSEMKENNKTQTPEFEQMLAHCVKALCVLRCPEAIHGFYVWSKEVLGRKLPWIKATMDHASGKYEMALSDYKNCLSHYLAPDIHLEESRDGSNTPGSSSTSSPVGSPKHITDGLQKLSLLNRHDGSNKGSELPDPFVANFIINQVCACYEKLCRWDDIISWQETLQNYRSEYTGTSLQSAFSLKVDINFIQALSHFDALDYEGARDFLELIPGGTISNLDEETPTPRLMWDPQEVVRSSQIQLLRVLSSYLLGQDHSANQGKYLDTAQKWCEGVQHVASLEWPTQLHQETTLMTYALTLCKQQLKAGTKPQTWLYPVCNNMKLDSQQHEVSVALQALCCIDRQQQIQEFMQPENTADFWALTSKIRVSAANLARKQHNLSLSEHLLVEEILNSVGISSESEKHSESEESIYDVLLKLQASRENVAQIHSLKLERESAKLLRLKSSPHTANEVLCVTIVHHAKAISSLNPTRHRETVIACSDLNARSMLTLVQWLQSDPKYLSQLTSKLKLIGQDDEAGIDHVVKNMAELLDMEKQHELWKKNSEVEDQEEEISIADNPILSESDMVLGRILHLSTLQCPNLAKAWFSLAGWCYKWGRKAVDHATHGTVNLSTDEKARIMEVLPKGISNDDTEAVLTVLSQIHTGSSSEEDISDQDQTSYDDGAETTRRQLLSCCMSLQIASDHTVDRLIELWRGVVRRVYHYYQLSAKAYFTYLRLNGMSNNQLTNMDGNITATLRILRLLVKHAWELREVLEDGLAHTPTVPWKGIIPQLFSRLNHPEPYVRQSVSDLLCRVAQDAPHLIVYPAVVGCSSIKVKDTSRDGLLNEYLSQNEDEDHLDADPDDPHSVVVDDEDPHTEDTAMLQNCFTSIVDTLASTNPRMISEVQLLVNELRRITLLSDELWLGTLNSHHADVTRRLQQLEKEVKKVHTNNSLSAEEKQAIIREKHKTVIKPTLYTMERLWDITSKTPETNHETWFLETYGQLIQDALAKLRDPPDPNHPALTWQLFKQLHHSLQQRAQKRTSLVLNMEEISPKLAALKNTVISMPGASSDGQVVTIEAIHNTVQILPTKTKPKKLVFLGSDGKKHPYLFKGLEDLHLDERIMQFLAIVNNMFAKANKTNSRLYHARHYSVTPLGARSGLIQWVDGATPLFSLYKRWQQREALAQQLKQQQASGHVSSVQPTVPRPSEVFYSKLNPALKEKGIHNLDNRKDWPLSVMRKVLEELIAETPGDLLAKELWCSSTSALEWWQMTQTYCRSTAVMSMIGYIIGLGDRHLDNLLIDLATGEVVHIDYNVCFEKGRSLRVPEKVPFRMSQNLEQALGLTGVEGTFRLCCEYVIRTMRKGRETLLTLLEAFVYDPLVDWTTGNEGGYTGAFYGGGHTNNTVAGSLQSKKEMEREITLSMFSIRMAEMKASWNQNKEDMLASLPKLQTAVESLLKVTQEITEADTQAELLQQQRAYLQDATDNPNHMVHSLPKRNEEYGRVMATHRAALQAVQEKLNECEQCNIAHQYGMSAIQGEKLEKMCTEVSLPINVSLMCFEPVTDFLNGAGQSQLVSQCEGVSNELSAVVHQRRAVLHTCLDVLHAYATIVTLFPRDFVEKSRTAKWQCWLQELICNFTTQQCSTIRGYMLEEAAKSQSVDIQNVLKTESLLQQHYAELNKRLLALMQRRSQESTDISMLRAHVQETTSAVHRFMQEGGMQAVTCMTSVVVTHLCALSKRYLIMEAAAAGAGERLMDLTSREGDWFLDELCSMSGNVNQLLGLLNDPAVTQLLSAEICHQVSVAMQSMHTVYTALQDLSVNFRTIIMPEAIKTLLCDEPSVRQTLDQLNQLINGSGSRLDDLIEQLEVQLINAIMGLESPDGSTIATVKKMRQDFDQLLQGQNQLNSDTGQSVTSELSAGQMLLMCFSGLFTQLGTEFDSMLEAVGRIQSPETWKMIDVVKEAQSIKLTAFNESTVGLLSYLSFIKELKAMSDFFNLARSTVAGINESVADQISDTEVLARPIKLFIAEYVRKHIIGLPSQTLGYILCYYISALHIDVTAEIELRDIGAASKVSLEELCKRALDLNLKNGTFEQIHLTQASTLVTANDLAWRKSDLANRLDNNIAILKSSLQKAQLQLARFQWLHEDDLNKAGKPASQLTHPVRANILAELRKGIQTLIQQKTAVAAIQEHHLQLESSVTQRLKWAAGANPTLSQVLMKFEDTLTAKNQFLQNEGLLATEVVDVGNAILHFEALRMETPEAVAADSNFLTLLGRCEEACLVIEACQVTVTEVEQLLLQKKPLPPGDNVPVEWMQSCLEIVETQSNENEKKQEELHKAAESAKESVQGMVNEIRCVLTIHHKLMSDIRTILKSMAKQEEQDFGSAVIPGGIREYVNTYKTFSENFTSMMKLVMSEDLTPGIATEIKNMIKTLQEQIICIYDKLVMFAPPLTSESTSENTELPASFATAVKGSDTPQSIFSPKHLPTMALRSEQLTMPSSATHSPQMSALNLSKLTATSIKKPDKVTRDPRTGKAVQEPNSYAVGVWRRVKTKLDGRDPDVSKRLSVAEQVDYVIKEATNPDNLAVLYEGWTPWV